jgi:hypothetical protein
LFRIARHLSTIVLGLVANASGVVVVDGIVVVNGAGDGAVNARWIL